MKVILLAVFVTASVVLAIPAFVEVNLFVIAKQHETETETETNSKPIKSIQLRQ